MNPRQKVTPRKNPFAFQGDLNTSRPMRPESPGITELYKELDKTSPEFQRRFGKAELIAKHRASLGIDNTSNLDKFDDSPTPEQTARDASNIEKPSAGDLKIRELGMEMKLKQFNGNKELVVPQTKPQNISDQPFTENHSKMIEDMYNTLYDHVSSFFGGSK